MTAARKLDEFAENLDAINAVLAEAQGRLRDWLNGVVALRGGLDAELLRRDVGTVLLHLGCEVQRADSAVFAFESMAVRFKASEQRVAELQAQLRAMGNIGFARKLES